jgi:hypothetical protein
MLVIMGIWSLQIPHDKERRGANRSNSTKFLAPLLLKVRMNVTYVGPWDPCTGKQKQLAYQHTHTLILARGLKGLNSALTHTLQEQL